MKWFILSLLVGYSNAKCTEFQYSAQPGDLEGWCHRLGHEIYDNYTGSVRTIENNVNNGTTEQKAEACFHTCTKQGNYTNKDNGGYATDTSTGYTDPEFWGHYSVSDIVSFKVHKTNGHCYCLTDRPVKAEECSKPGYTFENYAGVYDIYHVESMCDYCGVPNGSNDCLDECGSSKKTNVCKDCKGVVYGNAVVDDCGVCDGFGVSCAGCDGVPNSGKVVDACGVCGGDGTSCSGGSGGGGEPSSDKPYDIFKDVKFYILGIWCVLAVVILFFAMLKRANEKVVEFSRSDPEPDSRPQYW